MNPTPDTSRNFAEELEEILKFHIGTAYLYCSDETPASVPQESVKQAKAALLDALAATLTAAEPEKIDPDAPSLGYKGDTEGRNRLIEWRKGRNVGIDITVQAYRQALGIGGTDENSQS